MNEAGLLLFAATFMASTSLGVKGLNKRYLPIARPLAGLAFLLAVFSVIGFLELLDLETNHWRSQFLLDFSFILTALNVPLWFWMLIEYHQERQVSLAHKIILITLIHPVILYVLVFYDIVSNGFVSPESPTALIQTVDRIGDYAAVRKAYGWVAVVILITATPYLMIKKQRSSFWEVAQVIVYTALPFVFFALRSLEFINLRLAPPSFVLYLFWISRQYHLLDIMPIALQSIIDKIGSGILVANARSKLLYVNDHASDLLGVSYSPQSFLKQELDIPTIFKQHFDFSSLNKQTAQLEIEKRNNSKKRRYIDATLQPIFNPRSKKQIGSTISLHDVTERKQIELELQKFDRQKSEFFAGISHEFRTPLTLILGNLDDVLADVDHINRSELSNTLLQVKNNSNRLLNLVNQLLELSRLNSGSLEINPTLISLNTDLPALVANFESKAKRQNIRLHLLLDDHISQQTEIYFDLTSFEKVIHNMISNALKSIFDGGDVYIQIKSINNQYLQLSIRDTGCGIPVGSLSKIFEMFYSHQSDHSAWPQGTGVGLSLVKQLLSLHSADIQVSSIEGQGTTFTLLFRKGYAHFPESIIVQHQKNKQFVTDIIQDNARISEKGVENSEIDNATVLNYTQPGQSHETSEKLVLLVDDNVEMRAYIRKHLAMSFRVIEAADGEQALALSLQAMPDLVLSDIMMPKMNGYDLCKQLKTNPQTSHIPVLLLTAKSSHTEKLEGLELGADDYLNKPFDVKELTLRIRNLIRSRGKIRDFYQTHGLQKVIDHSVLPKVETKFLDRLQKYIHENIDRADLKISDLANTVHMSERSLHRKLKALTGETPKKMLLTIRLEQASNLLRNSDEPITSLSYRVGFSDASHFTRTFKAHFSMSPTKYRQTHKV